MPGLASYGFPALEGDYSTWTKKWEYDFPQGLDFSGYVCITFSPDHLTIAYVDGDGDYRFVIINVTDASEVFTSPAGSSYIGSRPENIFKTSFHFNTLTAGRGFSIMGKYSLIIDDGWDNLEVWKDGVKVWTSPLASEVVSGASMFLTWGIRYDGKYVIAVTDNDKLVCFEGS